MGLFDIFGKKDVGEEVTKKTPFLLKASFTPVRMSLKETQPIDLHIKVKNITDENLMTSAVIEIPKALGFDSTGLSNTREIRMGHLKPGEEKELLVQIYGNVQKTNPGDHAITITAYAHYRDYAHVLNSIKKTVTLRVI